MTEITYRQSDNEFYLTAKGHANIDKSKEGGAVCTAISILVQTLVQALKCAEKKGLDEHQSTVKSGNVRIYVRSKDNYTKYTNVLFEFTYTGLFLLAHKYPEYITIN